MRNILRAVSVGVHMAFVEMRNHKIRSVLSMTGVFLGVGCLMAILTLIGGIDVFLHDKVGQWVGAVWFWQKRDLTPEDKLIQSRSAGLRLSDGTYLTDKSAVVKHASLAVSRFGPTTTLAGSIDCLLKGATMETFEYDDLKNLRIRYGRFLSKSEYDNGEKVCIIPWEVEKQLALKLAEQGRAPADIIGETVRFRSLTMKIVGTYCPADSNGSPWMSHVIMTPLRTMTLYVVGNDPAPNGLQVNVVDPVKLIEQAQEASVTLRERHRGVTDFEFRAAEWIENLKKMLGNISLLMGIVSVVSLLSGGLGIMNVMLSSIAERIKEIGVRKALGARRSHIMVQFIAETTTLCCCGGMLGLIPGMMPLLFKEAIGKASDGAIIPTVLPIHVIAVVVLIVTMGMIFGMYPAIRASRLNPVEALRYE